MSQRVEPFLGDSLRDAFVKNPNPRLLKAIRNEFQNVFDKLADEFIKQPEMSDSSSVSYQTLIANLLAIYAMFEPEQDEVLWVPTYQQGRWVRAGFNIDKIPMVSEDVIHSLGEAFDPFQDQVHSYGLRPLDKKIHPQIIFKGTTFPTGEGTRIQHMTNFQSDQDVGKLLFVWGQKGVSQWLSQFDLKCQSSGASLGGILASMYAFAMPDKFETVYALNPPGFTQEKALEDAYFKAWHTAEEKPEIRIISQAGDPVSQAGFFVEDPHVTLWKVKLKNPPSNTYRDWQIPVLFNYLQHIVVQLTQEGAYLEKASIRKRNASLVRHGFSKACFDVFRPINQKAYRRRFPKHAQVIDDQVARIKRTPPESSAMSSSLILGIIIGASGVALLISAMVFAVFECRVPANACFVLGSTAIAASIGLFKRAEKTEGALSPQEIASLSSCG